MKQFLYILTFSILFRAKSLHPVESHDYGHLIELSLKFYEAQRSGVLPQDNRIPWRGDSAIHDQGRNGEDLSGGYYDASDYVKYSFTMAFTTTMLSWGLISYKDAYVASEQYNKTLEAIKWASDYFIKCHVSPNELYGQVGDFELDHLFWGRPEELNMSRPAYKIDIENPGSDLAGETSAALAATSIVFQEIDQDYSNLTLTHAKDLYVFATNYKGLYNDAIPGARKYYESADYSDEITWAAIWLYLRTNNTAYLNDAIEFYDKYRLSERPNEFFYNKKVAGIQVLLAMITKQQSYLDAVKNFCDFQIYDQKRTPKGLIYIDKFGTLSHAANIAFLSLQAADLGITETVYENFAKQQINYILGDSGRSYIVGYGKVFPLRVHHAASSCPDLPATCTWAEYFSRAPNPQVLQGALVSGPDENDFYIDARDEYLYNEVSLDYNAGFQNSLAGLLKRRL